MGNFVAVDATVGRNFSIDKQFSFKKNLIEIKSMFSRQYICMLKITTNYHNKHLNKLFQFYWFFFSFVVFIVIFLCSTAYCPFLQSHLLYNTMQFLWFTNNDAAIHWKAEKKSIFFSSSFLLSLNYLRLWPFSEIFLHFYYFVQMISTRNSISM